MYLYFKKFFYKKGWPFLTGNTKGALDQFVVASLAAVRT